MSLDIEVIIDTYAILKEYIPSKDRQAAADNLMSNLVDCLDDKELREFGGTDSYTKRSLEEYVDYDEEDYADEDDNYDE